MSFFPDPKVAPKVTPKVEKVEAEPVAESIQREEQIDPRLVIFVDPSLVKEVADDPSIPEGKTDIGWGTMNIPEGLWRPLNYNPVTGDMIDI
jgi:hypothetical protein